MSPRAKVYPREKLSLRAKVSPRAKVTLVQKSRRAKVTPRPTHVYTCGKIKIKQSFKK